ncbi:MAG: sugar kinase [Abitibacteriaceae bacterium]|nr:sugar kinase [Abditibacteriaceae bacterium]MBV9868108.1 sugar kinase [Abditibacteriaceae bacterium]
MVEVVTFGEVMMRLATPGFARFAQAPYLELSYGGGEANVAVSLANFGVGAAFVTRLPKNDMADGAIAELRGLGVDTSHIVRGGSRMGLYFLESGASQRASKVIYDRAHSAISEIEVGSVDWPRVFQGARWFHWTGITPALGDEPAAVVEEACIAAKDAGLTVSADLNFRKKLWSRDKARRVMGSLMEYVDICIANEEDAESIFGIKGAEVNTGVIERETYVDVARQLTEQFGFKQVAITLRESFSASRNGWSGMLYQDKQAHFAQHYDITIVDRVGGGDSFAAGLIYAALQGYEAQRMVEWAVAASALKHTITGDYNRVTVEEVENLVKGDASGRVQR